MRRLLIVWILIIPALIFGQTETPQLFEPGQIKSDIDTLISTLMDVHPTFQSHFEANGLQSKIDSIKKNTNIK